MCKIREPLTICRSKNQPLGGTKFFILFNSKKTVFHHQHLVDNGYCTTKNFRPVWTFIVQVKRTSSAECFGYPIRPEAILMTSVSQFFTFCLQLPVSLQLFLISIIVYF